MLYYKNVGSGHFRRIFKPTKLFCSARYLSEYEILVKHCLIDFNFCQNDYDKLVVWHCLVAYDF